MLRASPANRPVLHRRALACWLLGRRDEAMNTWAQALGAEGQAPLEEMRLAYRRGDWNGVLARLAVSTVPGASAGTQPAEQTAALFAAAGDRDRAFEWLELSLTRREPSLLHAAADPLFDPVRADPRFEALLRRVGLSGGRPTSSPPS